MELQYRGGPQAGCGARLEASLLLLLLLLDPTLRVIHMGDINELGNIVAGGFLSFLSMGPMPTGLAVEFIGALFLSHYYWVVAILQIAGGLLLLANRFVPLALVLLGPIFVNIICYHGFLNPSDAVLAGVV
ncbi:MAG TPA: hypothetical protein VFU37_13840, partial [Pyrinomonadaceae bacterium]|nr:hypothetical protein [Pyrinomonadaceae bacterium]